MGGNALGKSPAWRRSIDSNRKAQPRAAAARAWVLSGQVVLAKYFVIFVIVIIVWLMSEVVDQLKHLIGGLHHA